MRQIIRTGQIRLGHAHIAVNQLIDHRCIQVDDDFFVLRAVIIADLQRIIRFVQLPALRTGQLPDVVISMREMSAEADPAVLIGDRRRQQRIGFQRAACVGDGIAVIQAEHEALTGHTLQGGMGHAVLIRFRIQNLFFLHQADFRGHEVINRDHADRDSRRHMIPGFQQHIVAGTVEDIPLRSGNFCHIVVTQRQRICFRFAVLRGQRSRHLVRPEPEGAVLADNILHGTHFKHRSAHEVFVVHGRVHRVPEGILMLIEADQHRALLLDLNQALDRRIGHRDFLHICRFSHRHDRKAGDQQKQRKQDDRHFILCKIHPLYLVSQFMKREKAAVFAAALRLTSQDQAFLRSGVLPP